MVCFLHILLNGLVKFILMGLAEFLGKFILFILLTTKIKVHYTFPLWDLRWQALLLFHMFSFIWCRWGIWVRILWQFKWAVTINIVFYFFFFFSFFLLQSAYKFYSLTPSGQECTDACWNLEFIVFFFFPSESFWIELKVLTGTPLKY